MSSLLAAATAIGAAALIKIIRDQQQEQQRTTIDEDMNNDIDEADQGPALVTSSSDSGGPDSPGQDLNPNLQKASCSACLDEIFVPVSPMATPEASPTSSTSTFARRLGLNLPCPFNHTYCYSCFDRFIRGKLDDAHAGKQIFPVRCPDCSPAFNWFLSDETIRDAVSPLLYRDWSTHRYLDTLPKIYCPNPRCSEVIALPDAYCPISEGDCPACKTSICVHCRTVSHPSISCVMWQRSPLNPSIANPSDLSLRRMAKRKHWRTCSKCRMCVERTDGCSHMTCRCGHEFCHLCGSDWAYNGCTNGNEGPRGCDGRTWRDDPALHAPSKWKGVVKRTLLSIQKTPEKLVSLGTRTKVQVTNGLKRRRSTRVDT